MRLLTTIGLSLMGIVLTVSIVRAGQKLAMGGEALTPPEVVAAANAATATVGSDGVQRVPLSFASFNYSPSTIRVKRGVPVEIVADTTKLTGCFSSFVIPELNVWGQFSPANPKLAFTPQRAGTFKFSCAMGMGRGTLVVEG